MQRLESVTQSATEPALAGIGKVGRAQLASVIRGTRGIISVSEAAAILGVSRIAASKTLARWTSNGWLSRVRRGLYVTVPLESRSADPVLEEPWIIAERLYSPCYIGGWSAAEHWDLTEQIFYTIIVMTTRKQRSREPVIKGQRFMLRTMQEKALFGLKPAWCGQVKVFVSDPSRTVLDMLNDPLLGGGARPTENVLADYLRPEVRDLPRLIDYAKRLGNGAVFKRLGFFLERMAPGEREAIAACRENMSGGTARLVPSYPADRLVTRWRLWVPDSWKEGKAVD